MDAYSMREYYYQMTGEYIDHFRLLWLSIIYKFYMIVEDFVYFDVDAFQAFIRKYVVDGHTVGNRLQKEERIPVVFRIHTDMLLTLKDAGEFLGFRYDCSTYRKRVRDYIVGKGCQIVSQVCGLWDTKEYITIYDLYRIMTYGGFDEQSRD